MVMCTLLKTEAAYVFETLILIYIYIYICGLVAQSV